MVSKHLFLLGGKLLVVLFTLVIIDRGILVLLVFGDEIIHVGLGLSEFPTTQLEHFDRRKRKACTYISSIPSLVYQ